MSFASLNLIPELLRAVEEQGYTEPTPIQAKAIPAILERRDIMGCAQTGTGKTAGFTLPLLQLLYPHASTSTSPARHPVRALVLTPTRELAAQVEESVRTYSKYVPLRAAVVYGGIDIKPQIKALQAGVEIVVATPGRLLDHLQGRSINLSQVQILVLDEADRMLDMGFMPDLKRILAVLPPLRQNLLFSATFSNEIKKLANEIMRNPEMIEVARRNAPADLVTHQVYEIDAALKPKLLEHLIRTRNIEQALIFTRMKRDADRLARQLLRDGFAAAAIHSDRTQNERTQALDDFKTGKSKILVATDVAARGLDIDQLPYVINYELPNTPEDYVHRIGRTGRAGSPGEAISLVSADEMEYLARIEKLLKREIPRQTAPEFSRGNRETSGRGEREVAVRGERGSGTRERDSTTRSERDGTTRSERDGTTRSERDGTTRSERDSTTRTERDGTTRNERGAAPRGDRSSDTRERDSSRRTDKREERESGRPRARRTESSPLAVPKVDPNFDFSKPYESKASGAESPPADEPVSHKRKGPRPIGALLGGKSRVKTGE